MFYFARELSLENMFLMKKDFYSYKGEYIAVCKKSNAKGIESQIAAVALALMQTIDFIKEGVQIIY